VLDELLGTGGLEHVPHQRAARESYERGEYAAADAALDPGAQAEHRALAALRAGQPPRRCVLAIGRGPLSFWVNAAQSAVFNHLLDARLDAGTIATLEAGDLAWKHDSGAVFAVGDAEAADPEIARRLAALEISPSGPLWARGMTRAGGRVDERELAALGALGLTLEDLANPPASLSGARRPFRVPVSNTLVESGVDESGAYVRVAFDLPRGAYATVVLHEIMKTSTASDRTSEADLAIEAE
jgi:tRNA pseudouridine13 synthase